MCLLLLGSLAGPARAADGLLFPEEEAIRLSEQMRDLEAARGVSETQKAELQAKDEQIQALRDQVAALQEAARSQELNYVRMEEREKMRQENQAALVQVLQESRQTLQDTRELLKQTMDYNKSLQRELFWTRILGPLGIIAGVFTGGLMH